MINYNLKYSRSFVLSTVTVILGCFRQSCINERSTKLKTERTQIYALFYAKKR
jgi:hypothetical protein